MRTNIKDIDKDKINNFEWISYTLHIYSVLKKPNIQNKVNLVLLTSLQLIRGLIRVII